MRAQEFKHFTVIMCSADEHDPIWWQGYYFMDLTKIQHKKTVAILKSRGFETDSDNVFLPSGIGLKLSID